MTMCNSSDSRATHGRAERICHRGLTLTEVLMCSMLIGLVLVSALQLLGASTRANLLDTRRMQAMELAEDLMSEILQQYYVEPDDTPAFGVEGSEAAVSTGPRTLWDDLDDYHGWDASPPEDKDGTVLPGRTAWRRWVTVRHVDPSNLSTVLADTNDRGAKRIEVNVSYDGQTLAALVAVYTTAWIDMIPEPDNDQTTGSLPPVNQPPVAVVSGSPTSGTGSVTVNFDATSSSDPEGDPLSYSWDFGDGGTDTGSRPSHTFTNDGEDTIVRTVTLTATDPHGAQDTDTMTVTIYPN